MTVMIRVSEESRRRLMEIARTELDCATADETLRRLLDEHWERQAIEAMDRYREQDPQGWAEYLAEFAEWDAVPGPPLDPWQGGRT